MTKIKEMIGIPKENKYTGAGIKIGILDVGYPDNTKNFSNGEIIDYVASKTSKHTTKVASIIGGTYGIAPNAELYIMEFSDNFQEQIEWFISNGVDIINMSMGYNIDLGLYSGYSCYLDYIVCTHNISIIVSAGNKSEENTNKFIMNPGLGLNVYTVGSIDANKNISSFSSYNYYNQFRNNLIKPTIVAPGDYIYIPNTDNTSSWVSGTSYSAPMVTGIIALLLEEYSGLFCRQSLLMSAIINGATFVNGQTDLWDQQAGAGLINYENTRKILTDLYYEYYSLDNSYTNEDIGSELFSIQLNIDKTHEVRICLVNMISYGFVVPELNQHYPKYNLYLIEVYQGNNLIDLINIDDHIELFYYKNNTEKSSQIVFKVKLNGIEKDSLREYLGITISKNYSHNYINSYASINTSHHKSYCECGNSIEELHVLEQIRYNGKIYKSCIYCDYEIEANGSIVPGIMSKDDEIIKESANGSYVQRNGVIVLVTKEDKEAYLNGTLVFYNKDEEYDIV